MEVPGGLRQGPSSLSEGGEAAEAGTYLRNPRTSSWKWRGMGWALWPGQAAQGTGGLLSLSFPAGELYLPTSVLGQPHTADCSEAYCRSAS